MNQYRVTIAYNGKVSEHLQIQAQTFDEAIQKTNLTEDNIHSVTLAKV